MIRSLNFQRVSNNFINHEARHPLAEVTHFSEGTTGTGYKRHFGWYVVVLSSSHNQEGTLAFITPSQSFNEKIYTAGCHQPERALLFHPDLMRGTSLADRIKEYSFLDHQPYGFLNLSPEQYKLVLDSFVNIEMELRQSQDKYSKRLITSNIELFFNYCECFNSRQLTIRHDMDKGVLKRFEGLLNRYFLADDLIQTGPPSVAYFAGALYLSPNYFGDLIKKETGKSAQEYIHHKVAEEAKNRIVDLHKSIYEVAYELGFKYPQHFSRFFKNIVGLTPKEYRNTIINRQTKSR